MRRRTFLLGAAAAAAAGCSRTQTLEQVQRIHTPGQREGHLLRDGGALPAPSADLRAQALVLGSGVAGLSCAWQLARRGFTDFLVLSGPESGGNTASGRAAELAYPRGAHYLPLPSVASTHVRDMLTEFGVLLDGGASASPTFDERAIVHSPDERVLHDGTWHEGILPTTGLNPDHQRQHERFLAQMQTLRTAVGNDGRKVFCIPVVLSSTDPVWRALDNKTFKAWLDEHGYTAPTLHWYASYCCRDDYGADYDQVSAWAGLHYFASRDGHAANASDGAVLTWPDGLGALGDLLRASITRRLGHSRWLVDGTAMRVTDTASRIVVTCLRGWGASLESFTLTGKRVVCAMPLAVAARILPRIQDYGLDPGHHLPPASSWLVSNFSVSGYPKEAQGEPLAWDNVVYRGQGLGYVVATHQLLRAAPSPRTVFTAYDALSQHAPGAARQWLAKASAEQLRERAAADLITAYGKAFWNHATALEITVRGHAMATPLPGFLANPGLAALREVDGRVLFAHADLSGYSVFEEAAWWGVRAADRILA